MVALMLELRASKKAHATVQVWTLYVLCGKPEVWKTLSTFNFTFFTSNAFRPMSRTPDSLSPSLPQALHHRMDSHIGMMMPDAKCPESAVVALASSLDSKGILTCTQPWRHLYMKVGEGGCRGTPAPSPVGTSTWLGRGDLAT